MFIRFIDFFCETFRVTQCMTLNKYKQVERMLDWVDLYLFFIICFLQRKAATAINTSTGRIINTNR